MDKLLTVLYIITTTSGLILLKLGTDSGSFVSFVGGKLAWNINLPSVAGIALYGASFLIYMYLVSKFELGYIIPLTTAFVYIIIFIASFLIFHETFTVLKIIAISMIILGVVLLNLNK